MTPWQSELFDRLRGARGDQVRAQVAAAARELRFPWYAYSLWQALPLSSPSLCTLGNTPAAWQQRDAQQR